MSGYALKTVTPPAAPVLTPADIKPFLRVDGAQDDALIAKLIARAEKLAQRQVDRQFVTATLRLSTRAFPTRLFRVPRAPLQAVTGITYRDAAGAQQTLDPAVYLVDAAADPGTIELAAGQSWPATSDRPDAVAITFTAGYGAPADVDAGILLAIEHAVVKVLEHRGEEKDDEGMMTAAVKNALRLYWDGVLEYGEACA